MRKEIDKHEMLFLSGDQNGDAIIICLLYINWLFSPCTFLLLVVKTRLGGVKLCLAHEVKVTVIPPHHQKLHARWDDFRFLVPKERTVVSRPVPYCTVPWKVGYFSYTNTVSRGNGLKRAKDKNRCFINFHNYRPEVDPTN